MQNACRQCSASFEITDEDLKFYERVAPAFAGKVYKIPPPTLCPACRQQRRLAFRNEKSLYHRKCDLTGKQIISIYSPEKTFRIYEQHEWWSDKWSPLEYGMNFDFNRPFFEQFAELMQKTPRCSVITKNNENSDYTNYSADNKDCYLMTSSHRCRDTYYSYRCHNLENCIDCSGVHNSTLCYEVLDSEDCFELSFSQFCNNCISGSFLYDCKGCSDCLFCVGLRQKKYCILNKQYTKEEYEKKLGELKTHFSRILPQLQAEYQKKLLQYPHLAIHNINCENCSGDFLLNCKNITEGYFLQNSEDAKFLSDGRNVKNSMDITNPDDMEACYENSSSIENTNVNFSYHIGSGSSLYYCDSCMNAQNCFGCISLHNNNQYCILNKQYNKERYEELLPRIIEHMQKTGEWGEFFPIHLSPFAYNESIAQEYFPLTVKEVRNKNWQWLEEKQNKKNYLGPEVKIPEKIEDTENSICDQILICTVSGKPYKIIPQELRFYKKMGVPLPHKCPDQRHKERMALRNPRKLWKRNCKKCGKNIKTTYSPERPEIIYCEECYLATVY